MQKIKTVSSAVKATIINVKNAKLWAHVLHCEWHADAHHALTDFITNSRHRRFNKKKKKKGSGSQLAIKFSSNTKLNPLNAFKMISKEQWDD